MRLASGLGVVSAQTDQAGQRPEKTASTAELQRLVGSAKTPAEHHKLAANYLESAQRLEQMATEHEAIAKEYRTNTPRLLKRQAANRALVASAASHCDDFITSARKAAAAERALASIHEKAAAEAATP